MLRFLMLFTVLFAATVAGLALLPKPASHKEPSSSVASRLQQEADFSPQREVRVVYPAMSDTHVAAPGPDTASAPAQQPQRADVGFAQANTAPATPAVSPAQIPPGDPVQQGVRALNINTASADDLNTIVGGGRIGRTIVSHRPYRSVEDLLSKRVVRKSVYDKIKAQLATE